MAPFWSGLTTALRRDESYAQVATDDGVEGGQIQLPGPEKRKRRSCMCCGADCSFFFKSLGAVSCLWIVYLLLSGGVPQVMQPKSASIEGMPEFGKSLGCEDAKFFYKDSPKGYPISVPVSNDYHDHSIKIAGSGVGTLTIMKAPQGAKEVSYNVVMRGTDRETVDRAMFEIEEPGAGDSGMGRALRFNTPAIPASEIASGETCVRYDVTMSVPSSVKILKIGSKGVVQVKFADDAELDLKDLSVVLFKLDDKNMIIPSAKVVSDAINYEVFKGWIVGETTVSKSTTVTTQRGTGVTNLKVHQVAPEDPLRPGVSLLRTTTGKGRTDITYIASGVKRPIESIHRASMNGDVYLDYKQARFDGKIAMESKTSTITGASELTAHDKAAGIDKNLRAEDDWTHYAGSGEGEDKISVFSRGWTGLYL